MECLFCDDGKTKVIEGGFYTGVYIRKRKCEKCGAVFYTSEDLLDDENEIKEYMAAKKRAYRERHSHNKQGL